MSKLNHPVPHIIQVTTTTSALQKLSKINFKSEQLQNQKIIQVKIKIDAKLEENINETSFAHFFNNSNSVLITFDSNEEKKLFWKAEKDKKFHSLLICDAVKYSELEYFEKFFVDEIIDGKNGILSKSQGRRNLNIQDIGNSKGQNLLIHAATKNHDDIVEELLKQDFDVDHEDDDKHNAIEKAWINYMDASNLEIKNNCFKIILSLLKNNSKYPRKIEIKNKNGIIIRSYEFNSENCSEEIKNFVKFSENLHDLVNESNSENLKLELEKEPNLCHFYDRNNKSLMTHAIESKDLDIWKLLVSLNLSIGQHEIKNLSEFYKNYELSKKRLMRAEHQKMSKELPSLHVYFLLTRCKIGGNDRRSDERWNLVEEAFRIMDTDKSCSKVLQIAAKWKQFTIYFDFKHDTAYYLDPAAGSFGTKGIIYGANTIYIGAKFLSDDQQKHKVISTIIHELCHLAVFLTYLNTFDPYPKGDSEDKTKFKDEVVPECEENGDLEETVGSVCWYYDEEDHDSEYIVRVVQMLMHYYVQNPSIECENSKILKDRKEKFEKLFKYYEEVVEKDFDDFLKIINFLMDDNERISFNQLTVPMKARILHSEVNFQGQETTFDDIIGNNEEIFSKLTSKQIRDMLINGKCIKIGSQHSMSIKLSAIERQFIILDISTFQIINKTMQQLQDEVENSKILILYDSAGAGKTTTFEKLTGQLKNVNKNFWVCFIKLRAHRSIFDSFGINKNSNLEDVLNLLISIQDLKDGSVAKAVFKYLFYNDKVIMLLDGVDEISPNHSQFMLKILKLLNENTKNQLWISSRPQCARNLEENLSIKGHSLKPYTIEERAIFINEIFEDFHSKLKLNLTGETILSKLKILNKFFETLERNRYNIILSEVNNPLMIKMITELYIQGQIDLNPESVNLFDIFDKVTSKVRKEISNKVDSDDNDAFREFNLGHVHQILALKTTFNYEDIKDLSIMKTWKEERTSWTVDRIQRFGFVTLDSSFDKDPRDIYIDFVHRTYADFFVARFIISVIFDPNCKDFKNVVWMAYKLNISNDNTLFNFLTSYMQSNKNKKIQSEENIDLIFRLIDICVKHEGFDIDGRKVEAKKYLYCSLIKFLMIFISNNSKEIEKIWKLTDSQNLLNEILFNTDFELHIIYEILQISFGQDWYEKFNKNEKNIIFDETMKFGDLKMIEFVENNYNIHDRLVMYQKHHVHSSIYTLPKPLSQKVSLKIFMRFKEISDLNELNIFLEIIKYLIYNSNDVENLIFFYDKSIELVKNSSENERNFLNSFKNYITQLLFKFEKIFEDEKRLNRIKRLKETKRIWKNDKKLKRKFRKVLQDRRIPIKLFNIFSDEDLSDIKEVLMELFKHNKADIFKVFECDIFFTSGSSQNSFEFILDEIKFERFDKFLTSLNESNLKSIIIRKFLFFDDNGDLLINSITRGQQCFERITKLYLNDDESYQTLRYNLFKRTGFGFENLISKILCNMTEEIYPDFLQFILKIFENNKNLLKENLISKQIFKPIEIQEKFKILLKFLKDIFDQNDSIVVNCMHQNLLNYFANFFYKPNSIPNGISDARNFEIIKLYGRYSNDDFKELQIHMKLKFISLKNIIISQILIEPIEDIITIFNKVFDGFLLNPDELFEFNFETTLSLFRNKNNMANLELFLDKISNDKNSKKVAKRSLVYKNFIELLNHAAKDVDEFETLISFIAQNECSYDELKNILTSEKSLFKIFLNISTENYKKICELMQKIFSTITQSKDEICMISEDEFKIAKNVEIIKNFEKFLLDIFGHDDQCAVDKFITKIFRFIYDNARMMEELNSEKTDCYCMQSTAHFIINEVYQVLICIDHEFIIWIFYHENLKEIKILKNLTEKFDNHWEWAQDLFLDKFPFECIQRMSNENYEIFQNFLKLVFKSNKDKLSKEIQKKYFNDEILNNRNENCKKFVQAFMNDVNNTF